MLELGRVFGLHVRLAVLILPLLLAACQGTGNPPVAATPGTRAPAGGDGGRVVEVTMTEALRFEPASITVRAGETVRFTVTNASSTDHEFVIGDVAEQMAHSEEMAAMGGMAHDEPNAIGVGPGQIKTLDYTFHAAGELLIGCHLNGHYIAGMKGSISVEP